MPVHHLQGCVLRHSLRGLNMAVHYRSDSVCIRSFQQRRDGNSDGVDGGNIRSSSCDGGHPDCRFGWPRTINASARATAPGAAEREACIDSKTAIPRYVVIHARLLTCLHGHVC